MIRMTRGRIAFLLTAAPCVIGLTVTSCSSEEGTPNGSGGGGATGASGASGAPPVGGSGGSGLAGSPGTAGIAGAPVAGAPSGGVSGAPSTAGSGGSVAVAGSAGTPSGAGAPAGGSGGVAGASGGSPNTGGGGASSGAGGSAASSGSGGGANEALSKFSFFVTSIQAMRMLSGKQEGFGGDLRFGKADGLSGADEICRQAAELGMKGAGTKTWRAFLSAVGPPAVNARDRIGTGPWYDAKGRLVASNVSDLLGAARPKADSAIANDLPNERGEPNHYVGEAGYTPATEWDNHDTLTGSKNDGTLYTSNSSSDPKSATCQDWTSSVGNAGRPRLGHSWPRAMATGQGAGWASDHDARGCAAGFYLDFEMPAGSGDCVGCGGGYGGIYCFALKQP